MKKLILIIGFLGFLFAEDKYLMYVNKLVNYNFDLKFDNLKAPFEIKVIKNKTTTIKKVFVKRAEIKLLSIFDSKARVRVDVYLGSQLIKSYKKWVKVGDKLYNCKVTKITFTKLVLKCKNKTLIKTLNVKNPLIKDKQ